MITFHPSFVHSCVCLLTFSNDLSSLVSEVCCIPVDWKSKCNHFDCHILEIEVDFSSPELCSG